MSNSKILTYDYLRFLEKDGKEPKIIREVYAPFIPTELTLKRITRYTKVSFFANITPCLKEPTSRKN